jgi:hypothetical protein
MACQTNHKPEPAKGGADFRLDHRLCVENAMGINIISRIALAGLSYEDTPIEIPDERGAGERLLQERNWVRVMQQTMPKDVPRRHDAVTVIEQVLRQVGFPIQ